MLKHNTRPPNSSVLRSDPGEGSWLSVTVFRVTGLALLCPAHACPEGQSEPRDFPRVASPLFPPPQPPRRGLGASRPGSGCSRGGGTEKVGPVTLTSRALALLSSTLAAAPEGKVLLGVWGAAAMASVLSYESLVHAVAGAVVRRGLHARASAGCGASVGPVPGYGWGMGMRGRGWIGIFSRDCGTRRDEA